MKDLEIYHNITTSGRCTEDFSGNWKSITISPLQAAVLKTSDTGGFVEQHGISALQLDTGF